MALRHAELSSSEASWRAQRMCNEVPQPLACEAVVPPLARDARSVADHGLLKGNVPTPGEWTDARSEFTERLSWRKAARVRVKESSGKGSASVAKRLKRPRRKLVVMAEVLRRRVRKSA